MNNFKVTWGADPEFFVLQQDESGEQKFVPAYELTTGTKAEPEAISDSMPEFKMQADGPALEFTIPPADNFYEMFNHIEVARQLFLERFEDRGLFSFYTEDSCTWPIKYMEDERFSIIGCSPDRDAYLDVQREITSDHLPRSASGRTVTRYAGGHIHIGIEPWPEIPKVAFVRLISDRWAYHCMNNRRMANAERLTYDLYRINGIYREKPYGVEFRSPGASATLGSDVLADWASDVLHILDLITGPRLGDILACYRNIDWGNRAQVGRHHYSKEMDKLIRNAAAPATQEALVDIMREAIRPMRNGVRGLDDNIIDPQLVERLRGVRNG